MGLHFVLHGIQEQHDLLVEQLQQDPADMRVYSNEAYYMYTEYISKTNHQTKRFAKRRGGYTLNLAKLPPSAKYFYLRPLSKVQADGKVWSKQGIVNHVQICWYFPACHSNDQNV